jgi:Cu+-exporting ATPase
MVRYLRTSIAAMAIAVVFAVIPSAGIPIASTRFELLFGWNIWQFALGTAVLVLGVWAVVTCDDFPSRFKENEGIFLSITAIIPLYVYSAASLFIPGLHNYFDELALIIAVLLAGRWLKHGTVLSNNTATITLSNVKKVLLLATVVVSICAFIIWITLVSHRMSLAIETAAAVLLAASVEAPVVAMRMSINNAMVYAEKAGIKFNSAAALERSARVTTVLFNGIEVFVNRAPELSEIIPVGKLTVPGLLRLSAGLSTAAGMVYAESIMKAAKGEVDIKIPMPKEFTIVEGRGVEGLVETRGILLGNKRFLEERNIDTEPVREIVETHTAKGNRILYVASGKKISGILTFEFKPHRSAKRLVERIKETGASVALMTSENQRTADALAREIGIDRVYIIAQPVQRAEKINELKSRGECVAVVSGQSVDNELKGIADVLIKRYGEEPETEKSIKNGEAVKNKNGNGGNIVFVDERKIGIASVMDIGRSAMNAVRNRAALSIGYNALAISLAVGIFYPVLGITVRPGMAAVGALTFSAIILKSKRTTAYRILETVKYREEPDA